MSVIVIGAGIAGLSCAWHLAREGRHSVTVVEREPESFAHASGRNAAIFRPLEDSAPLSQLADRSRHLLRALTDSEPLLREVGLLLTAGSPAALASLAATGQRLGTVVEPLEADQVARLVPELAEGSARAGLLLQHGGVLNLRGIAFELERRARALGVELRLGASVSRLLVHAGSVKGVHLSDGRELFGSRVVLAGGAWCREIAAGVGLDLPLLPHRRHLARFALRRPLPATHPVVWDVDHGAYFRPEGNELLACPGDQSPHPPGLPDVDPELIAGLPAQLAWLAPGLELTGLQHAWACLRTLTSDGEPALGLDPRLGGCYWLAGLGGHGMSVGLAAGELVAKALSGIDDPLAVHFDPSRAPATG